MFIAATWFGEAQDRTATASQGRELAHISRITYLYRWKMITQP